MVRRAVILINVSLLVDVHETNAITTPIASSVMFVDGVPIKYVTFWQYISSQNISCHVMSRLQ